MTKSLFSIILLLTLLSSILSKFVIIKTENGEIRGTEENNYVSFLGVPYGEQPKRWRPPLSKTPWSPSVFNATQFGHICAQAKEWNPRVFPKQSEDCLNLNIWTPKMRRKNEKFPVVVYIHGGTFITGTSANFNIRGTSMANSTNTIYISINYRLGALGFLDGLGGKGNYGIMDQRLALEWIQQHIHNFGGDSKKVTLIGQSAGAMAVLVHLVSPKTKDNLFHKVFLMGSPFAVLYRRRNQNQEYMRMFAINLGCKTDDRECYEKKSLNEILLASSRTTVAPIPPLLNTRNVLPWQPTIDGEILPNQPMKLIQKGLFKKNVKVIIGFNRDETATFILKAWTRYTPRWQLVALAYPWLGIFAPEVLRTYPQRHHDARHTLIELGTDYYFYCGGLAATKELIRQNADASMYLFNHAPLRDMPNSFGACSNHNYSCHSAELSFFWKSYGYYNPSARTEDEKNLSTEMINTIANYAADKQIQLPKFDLKKQEIWSFSLKSSIIKEYRGKFCKMWERIGNYFKE
eukprot:gene6825-10990_t